jgi:phospholipid/cholesterol/gamma-HCH transport system permease protein
MSFQLFFDQVFRWLNFSDIFPAVIKTFFFGFSVGMVGCFKGYQTSRGTEGVGLSANSSVVISSMLIFLIDLIAVQITDILGFN